ncbi:MAG TPA: RNA polymerase sigma-70 factor [Daejeonella sp.]|uniref:RNA polymerase sigma-70 factor n=1 Tax=Daejeonella sp. TaxID=2805397 RepID=UPI002ED9482F
MENSDNQLIELILAGDRPAFDRVFIKYYKNLYSYALKLINDRDSAEEVVQNVFCRIWEKKHQLKIDGYLKSFLYRSVHNECLNYIKHKKVRSSFQTHYNSKPEHIESDLSKELSAMELKKQLFMAINELPEDCASVFQMSRFEQLKYYEIAEQLNISIKAVEYQMGKALKILRLKLMDFLPAFLIYLTQTL